MPLRDRIIHWALVSLVTLFILIAPLARSQQFSKRAQKQPPASLRPNPYVILDSVVTEQWPFTLPLVNSPTNMALLNPGQCVRIAVLASGTGHEHFFEQAQISWTVKNGGHEDERPSAPVVATKQIKSDGADFALGALRAAGVTADGAVSGFVTIAAAPSKWCVPLGAPDEKIEVRGTVTRGNVQTALQPVFVQVESLESGLKKAFHDQKEFGKFIQQYHVAPEPARLLPGFEYLVSLNQKSLIPFAFFRSAFVHDAQTVQEFGPALALSPSMTKLLALNLLAKAGVTLLQPPVLTVEDQSATVGSPDLPDAYDFQPTQDLFGKLDFLWAEFSANGRPEPVVKIVSALAWREDYEAFVQMQKLGKRPSTISESMIRGVTYMAAGWSLSSFERNDSLAADYIQAIYASPSTPANIKTELQGLGTNPAFKRE